ncbi:AaceriADR298Wp [[Ashbya] aceris (nom. inval.)]|nr:AaceriADR298Wp [[Ashbya] aceris (nom. inval.)]
MSSDEQLGVFQNICGVADAELARQFLDMAGGDVETAISLYFEHGGETQAGARSGPASARPAAAYDDEKLAESLQQEAYQEEENLRPPDQARHEQLVDTQFFPGQYGGVGGMFQPLRGVRDMFEEERPTGIFNQRLPDDQEPSSDEGSDEAPLRYEYAEETVMEIDDDGNMREYVKVVRRPKSLTKEERMALLFRPPFDLMSKVDLEHAKLTAREKKKWIMINIQAVDIFQCQMLNRDLWSDADVKRLVKQNFIFLQYQHGSRSAQSYLQFYDLSNRDELPHIAILDPLTGERLRQWNRDVPPVAEFLASLEEFLRDFSLDPATVNPTVKEPTPERDPTTLTEEEQVNLAIRESLGRRPSSPPPAEPAAPLTADPAAAAFAAIQPVRHIEPENKPGITTRIQIRTGDGKRIIRRFNAMEDTVRTIYEVIKSELDGFQSVPFILTTHTRENLIDRLDETINDAGLKNSSLLLESATDN